MEQLLQDSVVLPGPPPPGGEYLPVVQRGNQAFIAIQFPIYNGADLYRGRLGAELETRDGIEAARLCALNILAQVEKYIGIQNIEGLNHLDIRYQQAECWDEGPAVADGASALFNRFLKAKGGHSRTICAVAYLPRNFSVGVTANFTLLGS